MIPGNRGENWEKGHKHGVFEIEGDGAGVTALARDRVEQQAEDGYETRLG